MLYISRFIQRALSDTQQFIHAVLNFTIDTNLILIIVFWKAIFCSNSFDGDIVSEKQAAMCSTHTLQHLSEYGIRDIYSCSPRLLFIIEFIQRALNDTQQIIHAVLTFIIHTNLILIIVFWKAIFSCNSFDEDIETYKLAANCSNHTREHLSEYGIRDTLSCSPRLLYISRFIQRTLNDI